MKPNNYFFCNYYPPKIKLKLKLKLYLYHRLFKETNKQMKRKVEERQERKEKQRNKRNKRKNKKKTNNELLSKIVFDDQKTSHISSFLGFKEINKFCCVSKKINKF